MTENAERWCVLIPCSRTETWAVPQQCLGEIVTLQADGERPPATIDWRGRSVPVLDLGSDDGSRWRDPGRNAGLVAIFLGLKGEGCEYWGLAIRGEGLRVVSLTAENVEDSPQQVGEFATAAFNFNGVLCQVPDLENFQKQIAVNQ